MKVEKKYLKLPADNPIQEEDDAALCIALLVAMTNEYIEYRNSVFDGACIRSTMKIEEPEDYDYIKQMDKKIKMIKRFLHSE